MDTPNTPTATRQAPTPTAPSASAVLQAGHGVADRAQFWNQLQMLRALNPETALMLEPDLLRLLPALGPDDFARLTDFIRELLGQYLASPIKRDERLLLHDYFAALDRLANRLIADGHLESTPAAPQNTTLDLVPSTRYDSRQWCVLTSRSEVPVELERAVDAIKRRNTLVDGVLATCFHLLLKLDAERANAWLLSLCEADGPASDPDVARDLLRAWNRESTLPRPVLRQVLHWSSDSEILRHWPQVAEEADDLLRRHCLMRLLAQTSPKSSLGARLRRYQPFQRVSDLRLWLQIAIQQLGTSVDFFCQQAEHLASPGQDSAEATWRRHALYQELVTLGQLQPVLLVLCDLLLGTPSGTRDFAMALFGFTREVRERWEESLLEHSRRAIRRRFLNDFKHQKPVTESIRLLCLGDVGFQQEMAAELDLYHQTFYNLAQRELVVAKLAPIYASYREPALLETELARRYRRLMRVVHEDSLRRVLGQNDLPDLPRLLGHLSDLASLAGTSRRYLQMRRALDRPVEEIVANDYDFINTIRGLRAVAIRQQLLGDG